MFEDASVTDVRGLSFSSVNYQSENCQASNYEMFEDLNMNLLKIDLLDDISRQQSPVREARSPSAHEDVLNESLITLMTKNLEKTESDIIVPPREQRTHSPSSQEDISDVPLISSTSEELEIASEIKKENYSEQQSFASERWVQSLNTEEDASSVTTSPMNKEMAAQETEEDRFFDRSLRAMMSPHQCNDHPCTQLFYCQTCCKPICKRCATNCIHKHVTVDFTEFLETVQRQAEEVLIEAYLGIDVLADDMENMGVSQLITRHENNFLLHFSFWLQIYCTQNQVLFQNK